MKYRIHGVDNRGTKDSPFGFVYLGSGAEKIAGRVGFHCKEKKLEVWPARGWGPSDLDSSDVTGVYRHLVNLFPDLEVGNE